MADRYDDPYDVRSPQQKAAALRRRLVYLGIVGVVVFASAHRLVQPLVGGWCSAVEVLRAQEQIEQTRQEIGRLEGEVHFLDTPEGKDVEAKRQLILGPPDEVWIVVSPEKQGGQADAPVGIGARMNRWLTRAGGRALDGARFGWRVLSYWFLAETAEPLPGPERGETQEAP